MKLNMYPFESMGHASIYIVLSVFIMMIIVLRKNPWVILKSFLHELIKNRKYIIHLAAVIGILFLNKVEQWLEKQINFQADFTQAFFDIEQNFVATIQHFFKNDALTYFTTFYYVILFTAIMIASVGIYTFQKNYKLFYGLCYAIMINYIVAFPFYLFFPVNEVWFFHPNVDLLMHQVFPTFESEYRPLSGIDNCFPSLHTSLSITMAVIASKSGSRLWRYFTAISAVIVIFSIFYLGIHWFLDMCAGLALGFFAGNYGLRLAGYRTESQYQLAMRSRLNERNLSRKETQSS